MTKNRRHRDLIKERFTILLVFFFCILISSSEYIVEDIQVGVDQVQQDTQNEGSTEGETFFISAVDAVVPFVFATIDHVFHLIYEIERLEVAVKKDGPKITIFPNHFSEILLERIISINAP